MEAGVISQNYLLKRPPEPSTIKVLVDQAVMPSLIDAAAAVEQQIERIGCCARRAPLSSIGAAFGLALVASRVLRRRRR
jgi:hypothetical protein